MIHKITESRNNREVQIYGYKNNPGIFKLMQDDNILSCPEDKENCKETRCELNVVFAMDGHEETRKLCELVFHDQFTE